MSEKFLPDDYSPPSNSQGNWLNKFDQGETRIRLLSEPIVGNEVWVTLKDGSRKPKRFRPEDKIPMELVEDGVKHFWGVVLYNYKLKEIQVAVLTQRSVQTAITSLYRKESWGDPRYYDLIVERSGEGLDTKYAVTPEPKSKISKEVADAIQKVNINLDKLYITDEEPYGGDPFGEVIEEPGDNLDELDNMEF